MVLGLLLWLGACQQATTQEEQAVYHSPYDSIPYEQGAALVEQHCQGCHLRPLPEMAPKYLWEHHILPGQGPYLGIFAAGTHFYPDERNPYNAHIFPKKPLLSTEEWQQIVSYFVHEAPLKLEEGEPRPEIAFGLPLFKAKKLPLQRYRPISTGVLMDEKRRQILLADAFQRSVQLFDPQLQPLQSWQTSDRPLFLSLLAGGQYAAIIGRAERPADGPQTRLFMPFPSEKPVLDSLPWAAHAAFAHLNGDALQDVVISGHGNYLGKLSWYEQLPGGRWQEHLLLEQAGAIKSLVVDLDQNGLPDILALLGRAEQAVYAFFQQKEGTFNARKLLQFPPSFGLSDIQLDDFNRDGHADLLLLNGDPGRYPAEPRPYHGLRILLNDGQQHFEEKVFFPLHGGKALAAADYDQDGDTDIAMVAYTPDYMNRPREGFVFLEQTSAWNFTPRTFEKHPSGKWFCLAAGDVDGDGDTDLVLANNMATAHLDPPAYQKLWKQGTPAMILLENRLR